MHTVTTLDLIAEYERHLRRSDRAASTIDTYLSVLRHMDRALPAGLAAAHTEELRGWIFADHHQKATRQLYRAAVSGFSAWSVSEHCPERLRLDFDAARLLPSVKTPVRRARPITEVQRLDILARAERPYRDWFVISLYTGARCCEIAAMNREDIGEQRTLLHGKGDKDRWVPTHPRVWELAQQLPPGPVAVGSNGRRLGRMRVSGNGNRHLHKALGYPDITVHRLRHTFGTRVFAVNRDIVVAQRLLGHSSIATTQTYVDVDGAAMELAVGGLPV